MREPIATLKDKATYRYDSGSDIGSTVGARVSNKIFKPQGTMGEITVNARRMHTPTLMKPHSGLIILGLGNSRKSAALIPKLSETIFREKTSRTASTRHTLIIRGEGDVRKALTEKQTKVTAKLKRAAKEYFAFTRPLADMGDE